MGKEGDQPGNIGVRCSCIEMKDDLAQVPLSCIAIEALVLEETGDDHNVGGRGCHCPRVWGDADDVVEGGQQETVLLISNRAKTACQKPHGYMTCV